MTLTIAGVARNPRMASTYVSLATYDRAMAIELCDAIGRYDKLRLIASSPTDEMVALFEFSFDIPQGDHQRYASHGLTLDESKDCRVGPCVRDAFQHSGIASAAWPFLVDIARRFGRSCMILWGGVLQDNEPAVNLYKRLGFVEVGRFNDPESQHKNIDMLLDMQSAANANLIDGVIALSPMTLSDVQLLLDGEDDNAVRWLTGGPGTVASATRHITSSLEVWQRGGLRRAWGIYDCKSRTLAGTAEAHLGLASLNDDEANLSYSVFPSFRGNGYAKRGVDLMCQWLAAASEKRWAVIRAEPENTPSLRVAEGCHFEKVGMVTTPDNNHLLKFRKRLL